MVQDSKMKRSLDRILTTHTGSLPRPPDLVDMMIAREQGQQADRATFERRVREAVAETVQRQLGTGLDVVNDGEVSKPSYSTYVKDRLSGFGGESVPRFSRSQDDVDFPGYAPPADRARAQLSYPACTGPVEVKDRQAVQRDIANLKAATQLQPATDVFMTAVSPGQIARFMPNAFYPSEEAYIYALAEAMKDEYKAIVDAGFVLQLDCPDLASGRSYGDFAKLSLEEWKQRAFMHVEALNQATAGLPEDQLRIHLCWGNYPGPHHHDVPLRDIIDLAFRARAGAISFEAANPRHAHEWKLFEEVRLPDGKVLIPGVIDSCSNYIEHPELVAQRLERFASVAGRENVIAGVDCGFGTFVGTATVFPAIAWAKLASLTEGARLASRTLFG